MLSLASNYCFLEREFSFLDAPHGPCFSNMYLLHIVRRLQSPKTGRKTKRASIQRKRKRRRRKRRSERRRSGGARAAAAAAAAVRMRAAAAAAVAAVMAAVVKMRVSALFFLHGRHSCVILAGSVSHNLCF